MIEQVRLPLPDFRSNVAWRAQHRAKRRQRCRPLHSRKPEIEQAHASAGGFGEHEQVRRLEVPMQNARAMCAFQSMDDRLENFETAFQRKPLPARFELRQLLFEIVAVQQLHH